MSTHKKDPPSVPPAASGCGGADADEQRIAAALEDMLRSSAAEGCGGAGRVVAALDGSARPTAVSRAGAGAAGAGSPGWPAADSGERAGGAGAGSSEWPAADSGGRADGSSGVVSKAGSAVGGGAEAPDAWLAELLSRPGPPDAAQLPLLQAELARPTSIARTAWRWPALLIWPLSGLAVVAGRSWLGDRSLVRVDLADVSARMSWGVAALAAFAALAMAVAVHRGRVGFGLPSTVVRGLALGLTAVIALMPFLLRSGSPQPVLHAFGAPCAAVVMSAGALALGVTWWLFRHSQPVGASARALALGAATAAWTGIVISLHCPGESLPHLVWGHSLPMLALVGVAAWLLPRQLQP